MMNKAHEGLMAAAGQQFYKLMGSGRGHGFNPFPDWGTYALLQVWNSKSHADAFFKESSLFQEYRSRANKVSVIFMQALRTKGTWSGENPFEPHDKEGNAEDKIAVITRATIKWGKLFSFWRYVPTSHKRLFQNDGLLYTKGIGEVPLIQMCTFSIWKNEESLTRFAYQQKEHATAIKKTRQLNWYKEELFARFLVLHIEGDQLLKL